MRISIPTTSSSVSKKPICARTREKAWPPSTAYRALLADNEKPGYFSDAKLELAYFGLGDALRGQRHYAEAAESYEKAASAPNVGPELKIRSLVAAGECRDLNGERPLAITDYQAAIAAGPGHLPRRHRSKAPPHPLCRKLSSFARSTSYPWNLPSPVFV